MAVLARDSVNFGFLSAHDPLLVHYAAQAEQYFATDPTAALIKLRRFAEILAQKAAATVGVYADDRQLDVLNALWDRGVLSPELSQLFHGIRKVGNAAAHHDPEMGVLKDAECNAPIDWPFNNRVMCCCEVQP